LRADLLARLTPEPLTNSAPHTADPFPGVRAAPPVSATGPQPAPPAAAASGNVFLLTMPRSTHTDTVPVAPAQAPPPIPLPPAPQTNQPMTAQPRPADKSSGNRAPFLIEMTRTVETPQPVRSAARPPAPPASSAQPGPAATSGMNAAAAPDDVFLLTMPRKEPPSAAPQPQAQLPPQLLALPVPPESTPTQSTAVPKSLDNLMPTKALPIGPPQGVAMEPPPTPQAAGSMSPTNKESVLTFPPALVVGPDESVHVNRFKPHVGLQASYFSDNLDSRDWWLFGIGGLQVTSNLTVAGRAGVGYMRQPFTNNVATPGPDVTLDEKTAGISFTYTFPNDWELQCELYDRLLTGEAPTNLAGRAQNYSQSVLHYAVEGQAKPLLPLDLVLRWEHDAAPEARAVVKGITYNHATLLTTYALFDWWNLEGSAERFWLSDGNNRDHVNVNSTWLCWEPAGFWMGLGYAYATAHEASEDYWTPYQLNRYYTEAALLGHWMRADYNVRLRYGIGQQGVRPEDALGAQPTEAGWQTVIGLRGTTRIQLDQHWDLRGDIFLNRVPAYNETGVTAGLNYKF